MPQFEGSHEETFTVDLPLEKAKQHFSDLDKILANYGNLEKGEKLDEKTLHFVLNPRSAMGATYQGDYRVEYSFSSDNRFEWKSIGTGNMDARGGIDFKPLGDSRTQVTYRQRMLCDIPVNRLLGKAIAPIVAKSISAGIKEFLERMKKTAR